MIHAKVVEIGKQAISQKDPMIILFGETATAEIKKVAVIQEFKEGIPNEALRVGGEVAFGEQVYHIQRVGSLANENLQSIGHVTLIFSDIPEEDVLENALYLSPKELPKIDLDTEIKYS
ncbi:PTS glucitol/sorbitol transporter subunit IIA [Isobaculum melis]|uniref:PTS system, glucitol/sorbitol-specific IIA component n=1 Tax=Isobaculum melis TaxID=142588 RepID=A0A1H9UAW5_9LACT|nr:PTS glucitol/sorbitol transporter subunit IIA [Isobaculum melis]SES06307.1 PTS system, glucitol/sorbitol-specific IIA component [Isobaculum melis]